MKRMIVEIFWFKIAITIRASFVETKRCIFICYNGNKKRERVFFFFSFTKLFVRLHYGKSFGKYEISECCWRFFGINHRCTTNLPSFISLSNPPFPTPPPPLLSWIFNISIDRGNERRKGEGRKIGKDGKRKDYLNILVASKFPRIISSRRERE